MDIDEKVDLLLKQKGLLAKKQKYWRNMFAVGDFLIAFLLISVAFVPFFGKQELQVLAGGTNNETEPYIYTDVVVPPGSMGCGNHTIKEVNWTYFWHLFNQHSAWQLQAWHPVQEVWVSEWESENLNNWLNVTRTPSADGTSRKINLTVTNNHPSQALKFRFTFGIDLRVKQYVNKTGNLSYELTYSANETENYSVFFNWSDMIPLLENETVHLRHGIKENVSGVDVFWFRIIANHTLASGNSFTIDPTFGDNSEYAQGATITGDIMGLNATASLSGVGDNIIARLQSTVYQKHVKCALYYYNSTIVANGITEEKIISVTGSYAWYTFNFTGTKPVISSGQQYWIAIWSDGGAFNYTYLSVDTTATNKIHHDTQTYNGFPNPWTNTTWDDTANASIYCTYSTNTAPTFSAEGPPNASTGASLTPTCGVVCTDADSDTMIVNFYENSTGSFVHRQKNSTVSTGTNVTWSFTQASSYNTKYYWKITCDDGTANSSAIYHFTTKSLTWHTISNTIGDGTLANTTHWQTVSDTIGNGYISNTTNWHTVSDSIGDGTIANVTAWRTVSDTVGDGTLKNTTNWYTVSDTIGNGYILNITYWNIVSNTLGNGYISNVTNWYTVSDIIGDGTLANTTFLIWHTVSDNIGDGTLANTTAWKEVSTTVGDGTLGNTTNWITISDSIGDGTLGNLTYWNIVSNTIGDGTLGNTTAFAWQTVSDTIGNGTLKNTTGWHTISDDIGDGNISNTLDWHIVSNTTGDGTLAKQTIWTTISNTIGDGTLGNALNWHTVSNTIGNGELGNITDWIIVTNTTGDGTLANSTIWWRPISATIGDGILKNTSYLIIGNPLPINGSMDECPCCISLSIDVLSQFCDSMNITFYSNLSGSWEYFYIGIDNMTFYNVSNGTYVINVPFFNQYDHTYYWYVSVTDAVTTRSSPIYSFKTALNKAECEPPISNESWIAGLAIIFGGTGIILSIRKQKKRRKQYELQKKENYF